MIKVDRWFALKIKNEHCKKTRNNSLIDTKASNNGYRRSNALLYPQFIDATAVEINIITILEWLNFVSESTLREDFKISNSG